jgi:hypothetical protein
MPLFSPFVVDVPFPPSPLIAHSVVFILKYYCPLLCLFPLPLLSTLLPLHNLFNPTLSRLRHSIPNAIPGLPGLYIGAVCSALNTAALRALGITHVLTVAGPEIDYESTCPVFVGLVVFLWCLVVLCVVLEGTCPLT